MDRGVLARRALFGVVLLLGLLIGYPTPALQDLPRAFLPVVQHQPTPTATLTPTPSPTPTRSTPYDLRITYLQYRGGDEYVQITNFEPFSAVDMTGWTIEDLEGEHRYRFPYAFVLGIGAWVRVHSGRDSFEDRPTDLQWMRGYVWADSGGAAKLIDPQGRIVSVWGY